MVCIACVACSESSESIDTIAGKAVFRLETAVPDARTELTTAENGRYKAIWKAGDSYAVVQVADESVALSTGTVDEDAPSISAIAMFDQVAASSYRYIFASPTVVASADGSSVELSMADSQAPATMDTFDGSTDLILSDVVERTSQPNGVSVPFNAQRISAIGKMTIKNLPLAEGETATSVTFATTKPIAGKLSIMVSDIAAGTPLQNSAVSEPSAAVTVTLPQAQSGDFTAYFSCLPTILSAGEEYSVTVNTTNSSYTKQGQVPSDMSFTSGRMTSFAVNMSGTGSMIPSDLNRVIFYTSTDGNVVTPYKTDAFGAKIVSNTYENGQGVITFDGEVTTIGANAFWTRVTLASITLPQSVNSIGYYAFQGCNSLRSITIPDSVTSIDTNPFLDCKALEEFNGKFASEDKRCLIVNGVLNTFAIGSGVTEYNIPSDVNIVGSSSFAGCTTLTAVTIPSSTTVIRAAAFSNCSNLASVYCRPTTTPTGAERMFYGNAADRKIYVPSTAVDAYKSAQHWSDYADAIVAEEDKLSTYTDLSAEGTANCYLVKAVGMYKFKAVKGNSSDSVGNVTSADVLWESFGTDVTPNVGDLVTNVGYQNGYVYFSTPNTFSNGNASIAVRDTNGVILWSWHIWCAEEGWNDHVYANNAGTMMDRNLGATSATPGDIGAFGLMYQWGRKDPFMGSGANSGNTLAASTGSWEVASSSDKMDFAEENPMTFATGWYGGSVPGNGWHTSESVKGLYDPCPVGYRVPDGGENGFWATANVKYSGDSSNRGMYWTLADGETTAWYPAVGCRNYDSGALYNVGSNGYYWSASPDPSNSSHAYDLDFNYYGNVDPANFNTRGLGFSVRCVRE